MSDSISISTLKKQRGWQIQWLVDGQPDEGDIKARIAIAALPFDLLFDNISVEIARVPDVNWLEESYRQFQPFNVGKFYICGTHTDPKPDKEDILLIIDAATAFGSGEHGTTAGCLTLLENLQQQGFQPTSVLDVGCGSGILGIAACKLWPCPVVASDIDPECGCVTERHSNINKTEQSLSILTGDGLSVIDGSHDLLIANILAKPLIDMAEDLVKHVNPGGYAILSGALQEQADALLGCYTALGMKQAGRVDNGEWVALLLRKLA